MTAAGLLGGILYGLWPAAGAGTVAALLSRSMRDWRTGTAGGLGLWLAVCVLGGRWLHAASVAAVIAVLLAWDWWDRRGRKVARVAGEKGRAVIAGLLEKARDAGSPVPQGARA